MILISSTWIQFTNSTQAKLRLVGSKLVDLVPNIVNIIRFKLNKIENSKFQFPPYGGGL